MFWRSARAWLLVATLAATRSRFLPEQRLHGHRRFAARFRQKVGVGVAVKAICECPSISWTSPAAVDVGSRSNLSRHGALRRRSLPRLRSMVKDALSVICPARMPPGIGTSTKSVHYSMAPWRAATDLGVSGRTRNIAAVHLPRLAYPLGPSSRCRRPTSEAATPQTHSTVKIKKLNRTLVSTWG